MGNGQLERAQSPCTSFFLYATITTPAASVDLNTMECLCRLPLLFCMALKRNDVQFSRCSVPHFADGHTHLHFCRVWWKREFETDERPSAERQARGGAATRCSCSSTSTRTSRSLEPDYNNHDANGTGGHRIGRAACGSRGLVLETQSGAAAAAPVDVSEKMGTNSQPTFQSAATPVSLARIPLELSCGVYLPCSFPLCNAPAHHFARAALTQAARPSPARLVHLLAIHVFARRPLTAPVYRML